MRRVNIFVGGKPDGEQITWAYPNGTSLGNYLTPIYKCVVSGADNNGKQVRQQFNVLRFGVHCKDGKTANVVGLTDFQMHVIKAWIPTYVVHSASTIENGAWQVYKSFLIHDGPDNSTESFATIGCIEIMGPRGFNKFNDLIVALSGVKILNRDQQLTAIGRAGILSITYEKAVRPPLKRAS